MASLFAHCAVGLLAGWSWSRTKKPWDFWALSGVCAILPDADVVGFGFGIGYLDALGHRGFSHSLLFAALLGPLVTALLYRRERLGSRAFWLISLHFALVTASHGVLDALTDGGEGVAFFSPFDLDRYFFPFRPVMVSPIGVARFFSAWGWAVVKTEVLWIVLPSAVLALAVRGALAWRPSAVPR